MILLTIENCFSQSITTLPNSFSLPRITSIQKQSITPLISGLMVYDTDSSCVSLFDGNQWSCLNSSIHSGVKNNLLQLSQTQINSSTLTKGTLVYNTTTNGLYISDSTYIRSSALELLDGNEIKNTQATEWATSRGIKIPVFRIRHPYNPNLPGNVDQDFKILPYSAGMALEYSGVFETFVGQFSFHRGINGGYQGDGEDGWGAVVWVGDDGDSGGLRLTARNNLVSGGTLKYTEISSEQFGLTTGASAGNMRLRIVDSTDRVDFLRGGRGNNNIVYSFISEKGFKIPSVNSLDYVSPIAGLTVYDNTDSTLKIYDGIKWNGLNIKKYADVDGIKIPIVNTTSTIINPIKGLTIFDNTDSTLKSYDGEKWNSLNTQKQYGSDTLNTNVNLTYSNTIVKFVDASNGDITINLPDIQSSKSGLIFKLIRIDSSSNVVKVNCDSSCTINGMFSKNIQNQYECMNLYSNGASQWMATKETAY